MEQLPESTETTTAAAASEPTARSEGGASRILKKILAGLAVTAFVVLLAGAVTLGIIAYRLDADLAAARTELAALRETHAALQAEREQLAGDLADSRETVENQTERLKEMRDSIEGTRARVEVLNIMFVPLISGEAFTLSEDEVVQLFLSWAVNIKEVGDPVLEDKFEDMVRYQDERYLHEFLIYLMESTADSLIETSTPGGASN